MAPLPVLPTLRRGGGLKYIPPTQRQGAYGVGAATRQADTGHHGGWGAIPGQIVVLATGEPAAARGLHRYRAATGHWYRMAAMQNVGVALEAVRGWLSYEWADAYRDAFADDAAPGLTFLPYLTGERSPWLNPSARGGWLGLALGHSRGTMMRAAFEGVAFSLRAGLDAIRRSGAEVTTLEGTDAFGS